MRGNDLLGKMELVDIAYVEAANVEGKKDKSIWWRWGTMAACLCILVLAGRMMVKGFEDRGTKPPVTEEPPIQTGTEHAVHTPTAEPQKQHFVYNEVTGALDAARLYIPGYFTEALDEGELAAMLPKEHPEWECTGTAGFDGTGAVRDVRFKLSSSVADSPVFVTMSENGIGKDYCIAEEPTPSQYNNVTYTVYQYVIGKNRIALEAETKIGECYFAFGMDVLADDLESAKTDFERVLVAFSAYETEAPDLSLITADFIPEYFDRRLTLAEALVDPEFGDYMLETVPEGFEEESIRRYKDQNDDYLSGVWTKGYEELHWRVSAYRESDAACITRVTEKENYDLSLYPIPRAESVPEELREIVDSPIFLAEELTLEAVYARAYKIDDAGDSSDWRMSFGVKYKDVVIRVSAKGVEPEWVYEQLTETVSKQFSD